MDNPLLGVIIGGLLASIPAVLTFWLGKRSEDRRYLQELVIRAALEEWKQYNERAVAVGGSIFPLDTFIIHATQLLNNVQQRRMSPEQVRAAVRRALEIKDAAENEREKFFHDKATRKS